MKSAVSENDTRSSLDTMWLAYRRAVAAGVGNHLKTLVSPHVVALVLYCRITKGNLESGEGVEVAATTSYAYDNNGNVIAVGTTTTYSYDFQNRLIQSNIGNGQATTSTSYAYDPFGNRISQTSASSTTIYPSNFYSITSVVNGATTTATSTEYLYSGSTLLATIDQKMINGSATGTPITRYNHTDNLGSTQVTSDQNGALAQWFDYAPYGSVITSTNTGLTQSARQFEGLFNDSSGLVYSNARYLNPTQGQFTTEDPIFLNVGTSGLSDILNRANSGGASNFSGSISSQKLSDQEALQAFLSDPQLMNSYGYGRSNPIVNKDPTGEVIPLLLILAIYGAAQTGVDAWDAYNMNIKYAKVTSQADKDETKFKLGFDVFTGAIGASAARVGLASYGVALSVLQATGDTLDYFFGRQIYQNINYNQIQLQTSAQGRQQAVEKYNSAFSLSTGGASSMPSANSLWVTPSGAVVTFGGQLVAPPPSVKK